MLLAKAPIWLRLLLSFSSVSKWLKITVSNCGTPTRSRFHRPTGRNETRFVLSEVKCQSLLASRGTGSTSKNSAAATALNFFASLIYD